MTSFQAALVDFAVVFLLVSPCRAELPQTPKKSEPQGLYSCKTKFGVWLVTFERGGMGRCEAKFLVDDKVHEEQFDFRWSMKGKEIIRERISDDPDLWTVEHSQFLPNDTIRSLRGYKDGKLRWEAEKDSPLLEFLGLEARTRERPAAKPVDQAKTIVQDYIKAIRSKNLDKALNVVDVPWIEIGRPIIEDRAELTKWLKKNIDMVDNPADVPSEILGVRTYGETRERYKDEKMRRVVDQMLGKDDLVVAVGRRGVVYHSLFVKIVGGKAKVVGFEK